MKKKDGERGMKIGIYTPEVQGYGGQCNKITTAGPADVEATAQGHEHPWPKKVADGV